MIFCRNYFPLLLVIVVSIQVSMSEDLVVHKERLEKSEITSAAALPGQGAEVFSIPVKMAGSSLSSSGEMKKEKEKEKVVLVVNDENEAADEDAPLIGMGECRICQDEDSVNNLESPCACRGSLKYAHRGCVQHWCNEKGDITCEICHQPYHPGYVAPPRPEPLETVIDIGGGWHIAGTPINVHDPRFLAIAEAEHQFMDSDYESFNDSNASGASFCRSIALILMALLLMRHTVGMTDDGDDGDDSSAVFSLFLLRVIGFLFPCYIMVWAMTVLQRRRQRQEAAALAGTPFFVVQSGQNRGIHLAIAATPAPPPGAMPVPIPVHAAASMSTPRHEEV